MNDNPQVLAIRRNLQAGYVGFKQQGSKLLYTLDEQTYRVAYDFSNILANNVQSPITNTTIENIWKSIKLGDYNNLTPEQMYSDLKKSGEYLKASQCHAIRQIIFGLFQGFYIGYAKEWYRNNAVAVTKDAVKHWLINSPNLVLTGDIGPIVGKFAYDIADAFAGSFVDSAVSGLSTLFQELFIGDDVYRLNTIAANQLACDIATSIQQDETYANFKTVAGTLPAIYYQAWETFATREIWQVYMLVSRTVGTSDIDCPCSPNCYPIPPSTMIIMSPDGIQPYATRSGEYLEMRITNWGPAWYQNEIRAKTYYPFGTEGKKIKSFTFTLYASGGTGTNSLNWRVYGREKVSQSEWVLTGSNRPLSNGETEYTFSFPSTWAKMEYVYLQARIGGIPGAGSVTETQHKAMKATLKNVIICTWD